MTSTALVTVIVRTFNSADTVSATLRSLREQTVPVHVVVVDSGSTDGTLDLADDAADAVIRIESSRFTFGRALNVGAAAATTPVHAALSSHCVLPHTRWAADVVHHVVDGGAAGACGAPSGPDGTPLRAPFPADHATLVAHPFWGFSNHGSAWSAQTWCACRFDEQLTASEDKEWSWRATATGGFITFDPALTVPAPHRRADGTRSYYRRLVKESTALLPLRPLAPYPLSRAARDLLTARPHGPVVSESRRAGRTRTIEVAARWRAGRIAEGLGDAPSSERR